MANRESEASPQVPTGCTNYDAAPISITKEEPPSEEPIKLDFKLVFDATQMQPDFAMLFLSTGGAINSAAAAAETDFAITAGLQAAHSKLASHTSTTFQIAIPATMIYEQTVEGLTLNADIKLNIHSNRVGSAINGVIVETFAGDGAVYLSQLLTNKDSHMQVACTYGSLMSHACTLGFSNVKILNALDDEVSVKFREDRTASTIMQKAETVVEEWANVAWRRREAVKYKLSPTLTKSVAKVAVGVNASGFSLVHDVIDQQFPFSIPTLNSLFEATIGLELEYDSESIAKLTEATAQPGLRAAVWAQTIAAATSTAVNYLLAYRADGRTTLTSNGSSFTPTESWLRTPMRTPTDANDCDGSALLATSMIQTCVDATPELLLAYPYLRVVKNVVSPYYQTGVTVVGATSAEASSADASGQHVAGHALVLMIPTLLLLDGLHRAASSHTVQGKKLTEDAESLHKMRREALFSDATLLSLPDEEATKIRSGSVAEWETVKRLQPLAIEGTTPASPIMYVSDSAKRSEALQDAIRDEKAFEAASPNVARGLKTLHVGGAKDGHKFYHDFVEVSFHPTNPLYSDAKLRDAGQAASQFVLTQLDSTDISTAGATPKQLVNGDFGAVPLHTIDTIAGYVLDFSGTVSRADVMPARLAPMQLTEMQTQNIKQSMASLKKLSGLPESHATGHCVAHILTFSTLANNPLAVEHFVEQVMEASVAGAVDISTVKDLALDLDGEQAGYFVVVNSVVEV